MITANSRFSGDSWLYDCTLPANTTGEIRIPSQNEALCLVNGKAPAELTLDSNGIQLVTTQDGTLIFEAVAGSFRFTVNAP